MARTAERRGSAGVLLYRFGASDIEVLLVHPGGPIWRSRWSGWWQVPKGEIGVGEEPIDAARREFSEELGSDAAGPAHPLGEVRQAGGKRVIAFAIEGDFDVDALTSATFRIEWPPRSGRFQDFPEIDQARWFAIVEAEGEMLPSQRPFLDRLRALLADEPNAAVKA